ncbi:MAG: lytic transglycosylase domain-containing protein, partial [Pseudomonadota bacterium]
ALGHFYNLCKGLNHHTPYLTPENISFVNEIFSKFSAQADEDSKKKFDFDKNPGKVTGNGSAHWKKVVEKRCAPFIPLIEATFKKYAHMPYAVDPLLFAALMKRESHFDAHALSPVGAAGLLQIMPETAKELGMKNIYQPAYFDRAFELMTQERSTRRQAMEALFGITGKNKMQSAEKARSLAKKSLSLERKKDGLLTRYRKTLLKKGADDRFNPPLAIEYGYRYLSKLMKDQKGDMSLALASYNAGPHRVEQYGGIPPFSETVRFRNMVLKYYREYLEKAEEAT